MAHDRWPSLSTDIFSYHKRLHGRYDRHPPTIFLHLSLIIHCLNSPDKSMCYYRLIQFTCPCDKREIWASHCPTRPDGPWEIEGVRICRNNLIYIPCPQTIQQICMECFQRLRIGRHLVAGSHFPDVCRKVHELDSSHLPRTWAYIVTVTEEQFRELTVHDGVVLRHA